MRAGELELRHRALQLHRMLLVEHRERMVCERSAAGRHERGAHHDSNELTFHA